MSQRKKKQKLSQEELEIHQMFGESDSNSTISTPNPGQPPKPNVNVSQASQAQAPPAQAPLAQAPQAPPFDYGKMQSMFEKMDNFMTQIHSSGILEKPDYYSSEYEENEENEDVIEIDNELPLHRPDSAPSRFGVNVNESQSSRVDATNQSEAPLIHPIDENNNFSAVPLPSIVPVASPVVSAPTAAVVLPDASLPLATDRPPVNWDPDLSLMAWAPLALDGKCEWSKKDREIFIAKFSPDPIHDHLFKAVPHPPELLSAIQDPVNLERDYLFKRSEAEQHFYSANQDLACGFRPLLEVMSSMKNKEDMKETRQLLANVFQSMSSATCRLSRGRRELVRRFIPLDTAPGLFKQQPSHHCLFGSKSIEEALQKANDSKKINKDLVMFRKRS